MKTVTKSKGCAFLEFKHHGALQQGIKLHHSELDGRQINVELTAGGGGKGLARMKKLKERNKELEGRRVCHNRIVVFANSPASHSESGKNARQTYNLAIPSVSQQRPVWNKLILASGHGRWAMPRRLTEEVRSIGRAPKNRDSLPKISERA